MDTQSKPGHWVSGTTRLETPTVDTFVIAMVSFVALVVIGVFVGRAAHRRVNARQQARARAVQSQRRPIWYQMQDETPLPRESDWVIPDFVWPETPVAPGIGEH
jgi:hypothetical protein